MPDNLYIVKNPKLRESKDYALLRAEGLTKLERLASTVWTDYNVHDPGITFLELLCYAITELGYRTGYDIGELLDAIAEVGARVTEANPELADGPGLFAACTAHKDNIYAFGPRTGDDDDDDDDGGN